MDKEIKQKWIEALRSGEYEQGSFALRPAGHLFCCLGVLCEIHPDVEWEDDVKAVNDRAILYKDEVETKLLPTQLARELGLDNEGVTVDASVIADDHPDLDLTGCNSLSCLNDKGIPFDVIADIIEEQL